MNGQELRTRIEEQVSLEKTAHQHVTDMVLADCVEKEFLQTALNEIMPGHYCDVVEERSIAKLCGYPICSNRLTKLTSQKYHISMKSKKVYDITERKLFCSSKCFKSSKYVESQISTDPLWLRNKKVMFEFLEFPPKKSSDHRERFQWRLDPISAQDVDIVQSHTEQLNLDGTSPCVPYCEDHIDDIENLTKEPIEVKTTKQAKHIELPETCIRKTDVVKIERLCEILDEWCTFDTYKFFKSKVYNQSYEECDSSIDKEEAVAKKLKSAKKFLEDNVEWKTEIPGTNIKPSDSKPFISPPVDSRAQNSIRRNIVSQKLKNSFSEVFSELCISYCDFQFDLFTLLKTFRLTSQNILLKPNEWRIMAIVMLHGFAKGDMELQGMIDKRVEELERILLKYGTDKDEFARLLSILDQYVHTSPITKEYNEDGDCEYDNDSLD